MVISLQAKEITLEDLQDNFQLQLNNSASFFGEWREDLPSLTDEEKHYLDRVKRNYFNLVTHRPLLEEAVKMVILSFLLDLAGFYLNPARRLPLDRRRRLTVRRGFQGAECDSAP